MQAEDGTKQVEPWELCYQERLAKFEKWLEDNRRRFDNCPGVEAERLGLCLPEAWGLNSRLTRGHSGLHSCRQGRLKRHAMQRVADPLCPPTAPPHPPSSPAGDLLRLVAKGDGAGALAACEVEWAMLEANEDRWALAATPAGAPNCPPRCPNCSERLPPRPAPRSLTTPTLAALFPSGLDQHALMRERLPVLVDGLEGAAAEAERARSEGRLPVDEPLQVRCLGCRQ